MRTLSWLRALLLRQRRPRRRFHRADDVSEVLEFRRMLSAAPIADGFEQHFDFGTAFSPVATGDTRVASNTTYSAAVGYGWIQGTIDSRDRGSNYGDERVRDFNFTELGTFAVDVPDGVYDVTLTMGDGLALRDEMGIFLEGSHVDTVTALQGQYESRTYTINVSDGQLTLTLDDLGGQNAVVMINALHVVQIGGSPSGPQILSSAPADEAVGSMDRITLTFNKEIDAETFTTADVTLIGPAGEITVSSVTPRSGTTFDVLFDTQSVLGDYTLSVGPDIADREGNLMNQDGDDVNGEAVEDGFSVTFTLVETPAYEQTFDFGTVSSPVGTGAIGVSENSSYSHAAGFGWASGSIASRDRGSLSGSDLTRDFHYMTSGSFVVDVLAEEAIYDVTVTLGDALAARDEMGLLIEGPLLDTITTERGAYETRTFRVTIADGQLTLQLEDLGGSDPVAVINSLHIRHVETVTVPNPDEGDDTCDDGDHHGRLKAWEFLSAVRKRKDHRLPAVASPVAFHPPGHSRELPGDDNPAAALAKRLRKGKGGK